MKHSETFPLKSLIPFLLMTFALSWGILGAYLVFPDRVQAWFGPLSGSHPLFFLAVYAPAISALVLILKTTGWQGMRRFLSRLGYWGLNWKWSVFLLVGLPIPFFLGAAVEGRLNGPLWPAGSGLALLFAMGGMLIKGPVEELGWRGFALPVLQRHMPPYAAALMLGMIWGFWHMPAFYLSGTPQSSWSISAFYFGTVALSLLATTLYNRSNGSLLCAGLFHFQMINPLWPDGQPTDTLFFIGLAIGVTLLDVRMMLTGGGAVTQVLPGAGGKV